MIRYHYSAIFSICQEGTENKIISENRTRGGIRYISGWHVLMRERSDSWGKDKLRNTIVHGRSNQADSMAKGLKELFPELESKSTAEDDNALK